MLPFFGELISRTDEARRDFETSPAIMDGVAHGLALERYRALLLELYQVVWHFNPICAAAADNSAGDSACMRAIDSRMRGPAMLITPMASPRRITGAAIAAMPGANTSSIIAKPRVRAACRKPSKAFTVVGAFGP